MHDVVVIGGGVIGLAVARELAQDESVLLLERGTPGEGTSWAAAGMLSPQSEADDAGPFFQLSLAGLRMYKDFVRHLEEESGVDPEYIHDGVLVLAPSEKDFHTLQSRARWQNAAGLRAEVLEAAEVYAAEPLVTAEVCGGLLLPNDHQVSPRRLTKSLAEACRRRRVEIRTGVAVDGVISEKGRVTGVVADGQRIEAGQVVVCGGVWSGQIEGLSPSIPLTPRKGQILALMAPHRMFHHMIRWGSSYFVPRRDGEVIVGATNEDVGFDRSLTAAGVGRLLADAQKISSHVGAFPIRETWTGLRPATPDGLPIIGESSIRGLWYAAGHYRNGILLAPITAAIVASIVAGNKPPIPIEPFDPHRFKKINRGL
jgi:glycine oxidase